MREREKKGSGHWHGPPPEEAPAMLQAWTRDGLRSRESLSYRLGFRDPQIVSLTREQAVELMLASLPGLESAVVALPEGPRLLRLARGLE